MRTTIRSSITLVACLAALFAAACGGKKPGTGKPAEVPQGEAARAENFASDALFALQVRDYARATTALDQALRIRPDFPEWWEMLGSAHKLQGSSGAAKSSYAKAADIWGRFYEETRRPQPGIRQVVALVYAGRESTARSRLESLRKAHPVDTEVKAFEEGKVIEQLLAGPAAYR